MRTLLNVLACVYTHSPNIQPPCANFLSTSLFSFYSSGARLQIFLESVPRFIRPWLWVLQRGWQLQEVCPTHHNATIRFIAQILFFFIDMYSILLASSVFNSGVNLSISLWGLRISTILQPGEGINFLFTIEQLNVWKIKFQKKLVHDKKKKS